MVPEESLEPEEVDLMGEGINTAQKVGLILLVATGAAVFLAGVITRLLQ